jgi:hypothetical protein
MFKDKAVDSMYEAPGAYKSKPAVQNILDA